MLCLFLHESSLAGSSTEIVKEKMEKGKREMKNEKGMKHEKNKSEEIVRRKSESVSV